MDPFVLGCLLVAVAVLAWYFLDRSSTSSSASSSTSRSSSTPSSRPPSKFQPIGDKFSNLDDISLALRKAGLEACNLILVNVLLSLSST